MITTSNSTYPGSSQVYIVAQVRPLYGSTVRLQILDDGDLCREFNLSVDESFVQVLHDLLRPSSPAVPKTVEERLAALERRMSDLE